MTQIRRINNNNFRTNTSLPTDQISSNIRDPRLIQATRENAILRQEYLKKYPWATDWSLENLKQFENNATPVRVNGVLRTPITYKPRTSVISSDTKTEQQHKSGQQAAKRELEKQKQLEETAQASEVINHPYNPIGWVPGLRTLFNTGADQQYSRYTGQTTTPYTLPAATSIGTDALTLGFGIGPMSNYAGSYAGTVAGGLIGEQFDHPYIGEIAGGIAGGLAPNLYRNIIYRFTPNGFRIGNNAYSLSYHPQGTMSFGGLGELSGLRLKKQPINSSAQEVISVNPQSNFASPEHIVSESRPQNVLQRSDVEQMLQSNGYSMDHATSNWYRNNSYVSFNDNGTIRLGLLPNIYNNNNIIGRSIGRSIEISPEDFEQFISGHGNLDTNFTNLNDFFIRNQNLFNGRLRTLSFGDDWILNHQLSAEQNIPVVISSDARNIELSGNGFLFSIPIADKTNREIYNAINNHLRSIKFHSLTDDQIQLIKSQFPDESYDGFGNIVFRNPKNNGKFLYNGITRTFSLNAPGFRNISVFDINDLSPEILTPKQIPTIITSRDQVPELTRENSTTNWGEALQIDPRFNEQINFGLQRGRPTMTQVQKILDAVPKGEDTSFFIQDINPDYRISSFVKPNSTVPLVHLNMTPQSRPELSRSDKRIVATTLAALSQGAKGADIVASSKINPTISRFVSDLAASDNLSMLDKHNLLREVLTNPNEWYNLIYDSFNYSPFSWLNNILLGKNSNRYFAEPAMNTQITRFNNFGNKLSSPIKELFNMNPGQPNEFEAMFFDLPKNRAELISEYLKLNTPWFYQNLTSNDYVPYPVITFRKKGGKLTKKFGEGGATPKYFKIYGINPNKFKGMFDALKKRGLSNQVAFEISWQSMKEVPKSYYSFGTKFSNIDSWADNVVNHQLKRKIYQNAVNAKNFNEYRKATFPYNREVGYTQWLLQGRDEGKQFINDYIKENNLGEPIAYNNFSTTEEQFNIS